jgi:hypothetical protein
MSEDKDQPKKTKAELKAEHDLLMARAAIKHAIQCFAKGANQVAPDELKNFWLSLDPSSWQEHLKLFTTELKKYKNVAVKKILFDIDHYVKDCRKLMPDFRRTKEEILLLVAIGQIKPSEFVENLEVLPSNREKLDRKIHKQIKELDWQDDQSLRDLDKLTKKLDSDRIKKDEIESIEKEIKAIEVSIQERKKKRDDLAIKLVEWKSRGTIDIPTGDGVFRLEA